MQFKFIDSIFCSVNHVSRKIIILVLYVMHWYPGPTGSLRRGHRDWHSLPAASDSDSEWH